MRREACIAGLLAVLLVLGATRSASAGFSIVSEQIQVDQADQQLLFSVNFDQPPDFVTKDVLGRRADSFQYEIVPNTTTPVDQLPFTAITAVIRGDEITGGMIPIRNGIQTGSDPNPASGGWGTIRGTVPFTITGDQLNFAASFNLLGTTNGDISYRLFSTSYGTTFTQLQGTTSSTSTIPLPAALPTALLTAGAFVTFGLIRRSYRR